MYEHITDAYVEDIIDLNKENWIVQLLKKKYERKEEIIIDCSRINTKYELVIAIKQALQYPEFCGNNWDSIEDLIYDIILPKKLIFFNWHIVEKKLPQDTIILKSILDRNSSCLVVLK